MSRYAVLLGQIERDLADLEQILGNTTKLVAKIQKTGDMGTIWGRWPSICMVSIRGLSASFEKWPQR